MSGNSLKTSTSFVNFKRALTNLEVSLAAPIQEPRDLSGIIKDFEMTYELSWKVLKAVLRTQGHDTLGAKDVFTRAYQLGFLAEEGIWLRMIQDRNQTSHVYDEASARLIVDRILAEYRHAFAGLETSLDGDGHSRKPESNPRKAENPDHKRQTIPDIEVHPWRLCPYGEHSREAHPLHVEPSKKNPSGITTRHYRCVKNPDYKDALYPHEIEQIAESHFASLMGPPKAYSFKRPNGNSYDSLIRGWTRYWNEVLKPTEALDPDFVKALIFTESGFKPKTVHVRARGLMQLLPTAVKALKNYKGELRDHFVILTRDELLVPGLSICGGIRWFFHKKKLRETRLKRSVSWIESVAEYKGVGMEDKEVRIFKERLAELKAAR